MLKGALTDEAIEEHLVERLLFTKLDIALNWARANCIWPLTFGLACCAMEFIPHLAGPRFDVARFGYENGRATPRQADLLVLSGRLPIKMAPVVRRLYDQMLEPKWVIAMGACSSSGGVFNNYAVLAGADKLIPIDVHIPGCPPRPEALIYGILKLRRMIEGHPDEGWRARYGAEGTEERA